MRDPSQQYTLEENARICQQIVQRKHQQQRQISQMVLHDHQMTPVQQKNFSNNQHMQLPLENTNREQVGFSLHIFMVHLRL